MEFSRKGQDCSVAKARLGPGRPGSPILRTVLMGKSSAGGRWTVCTDGDRDVLDYVI